MIYIVKCIDFHFFSFFDHIIRFISKYMILFFGLFLIQEFKKRFLEFSSFIVEVLQFFK